MRDGAQLTMENYRKPQKSEKNSCEDSQEGKADKGGSCRNKGAMKNEAHWEITGD